MKTRKMANRKNMWKNMWVPEELYNALVNAARESHKTFKEYTDELSFALMFGEFDPTKTRRV